MIPELLKILQQINDLTSTDRLELFKEILDRPEYKDEFDVAKWELKATKKRKKIPKQEYKQEKNRRKYDKKINKLKNKKQ